MRMQNDGEIPLGQGGLQLHDYAGAGAVTVESPGTLQLAGTVRLNPGSNWQGAGRVDLGVSTTTGFLPVEARIAGHYGVRGLTSLRRGSAVFLRGLNEPAAAFETWAASSNDVVRFGPPRASAT